MHPIKFRAWDKKGKRFVPAKELSLGAWPSGNSDNVFWFLETENAEELPQTGYKLQQFTGLLDKNGKEIYEGDIVRLIEDPRQPLGMGKAGDICQVMHDSRYTGFGVWHDDLEELESLGNFSREGQFNKVEVLGNIYENPELIKS